MARFPISYQSGFNLDNYSRPKSNQKFLKGLGTKPGIFIGLDSTLNSGAFKVFKHPSDVGA